MRQHVEAVPSEGSGPALAAYGLVQRYGRQPALRALDLVLDQPGLTALVGPNGAGKSTLIRAWVGLDPPSGGTVTVRGIDRVAVGARRALPGRSAPPLGTAPRRRRLGGIRVSTPRASAATVTPYTHVETR